MKVMTEDAVASAFQMACLAELEALKPGNVHIFADGHGMVVQDFIRSAEVAAQAIAPFGLTVGQRILAAVEATRQAVGCNTNLGIILLCAPLVQAALHGDGATLRERLHAVLASLTIADAELAFRAILLASPAGLGSSAHHDVHDRPQVTLLDAMREAQGFDRIAWQYVHDFADILDFGVPRYRERLQRWKWSAWATTAVHLGFMARHCDTHIMRKQGEQAALSVQAQARAHEQQFLSMENPKNYQRHLLDFDAALKGAGLNPGTSADLTVATLLVTMLEDVYAEKRVTAEARS